MNVKDERQLFKEGMDQIEVPDKKLDDIIEKTIYSVEHTNSNSKRRPILYSVAAAIIILGIVIGSANVSPSFAAVISNIPIIGSFVTIGDEGLKNVSEHGLADVVEQTITKDGTMVTIDEAYYDGTRLTIGYSITMDRPLLVDENPKIDIAGIEIDGVKLHNYGLNGAGKVINETTYSGYYNVDNITADKLPDSFDLGLNFVGEDNEEWKFNFPIEMHHVVKNQAIQVSQQVDSMEINLLHVQTGPAGTVLEYEIVTDKDMDLEIAFFDFAVTDDLNKDLTENAGSATIEHLEQGDKKVYKGKTLLNPLSENASKIIVTPYFTSGGFTESVGDSEKTEIKTFDSSDVDIEFKKMIVDLN